MGSIGKFSNDGKILKNALKIKGGHLVSHIFDINRNEIELAFVDGKGARISIIERYYGIYSDVRKYAVNRGDNFDFGIFDTFSEANDVFLNIIKDCLENNFYCLDRYKQHLNGKVDDYDYLSLLVYESEILKKSIN